MAGQVAGRRQIPPPGWDRARRPRGGTPVSASDEHGNRAAGTSCAVLCYRSPDLLETFLALTRGETAALQWVEAPSLFYLSLQPLLSISVNLNAGGC